MREQSLLEPAAGTKACMYRREGTIRFANSVLQSIRRCSCISLLSSPPAEKSTRPSVIVDLFWYMSRACVSRDISTIIPQVSSPLIQRDTRQTREKIGHKKIASLDRKEEGNTALYIFSRRRSYPALAVPCTTCFIFLFFIYFFVMIFSPTSPSSGRVRRFKRSTPPPLPRSI